MPGRALAERVHDAGYLAAGDGRQLDRGGGGALVPLPQGGVQEVDARGPYGDADLAGARPGVLGLLVGEVPGRAEGVQSDGVHEVPLGVGAVRSPPGASGAAAPATTPLFNLKRA
ncbi:hypothetical protein GCM10009535_54940 [Streptomyces thermocarboxydovorans]|uniref:Uncharacterized protein n=1 Tax=Streptomyces thermocarboxydovorans TaxID=59298 RepID=A0ABN1HUG0_9ACTN